MERSSEVIKEVAKYETQQVTKHELQLVERIGEMPWTETHDHIFEVPRSNVGRSSSRFRRRWEQFVERHVKGSRLASSIPEQEKSMPM